MKRVRQRLKEVTERVLNAKNVTPEEYKTYQEELKTLRELVSTHKALNAYIEDYGDTEDDDLDAPSGRNKRVSLTEWD